MVGHSSGEIAAAYCSGALSHHSACQIAFYRGRIVQDIYNKNSASGNPGAMMSVNFAASEMPEILRDLYGDDTVHDIHIACVNSPTNVTLSENSP